MLEDPFSTLQHCFWGEHIYCVILIIRRVKCRNSFLKHLPCESCETFPVVEDYGCLCGCLRGIYLVKRCRCVQEWETDTKQKEWVTDQKESKGRVPFV